MDRGAVEVVLILQQYSEEAVREIQRDFDCLLPLVFSVHAQRLGVFGARNQGVACSRGEVIAFLDDDCRVPPSWVVELRRIYEDPSVGGAGGYADHPGRGDGIRRWFYSIWHINPDHYLIDGAGFHLMPQFNPPGCEQEADWLSGNNMSFRREVLEAVGLFDPIYGNYGFDDVDYSLRVRRAGWRLVVSHRLTVQHNPSPAGRDAAEFRAHEEERHRVYFAARAVGHNRWWKIRFALRFARHFAILTQVAIVQRQWNVPVAALRGAIAGLREVDDISAVWEKSLVPRELPKV